MARTKQTARRSTHGPSTGGPFMASRDGACPTIPQQLTKPFHPTFDAGTWTPPMEAWITDLTQMHQVLTTPELLENILAHVDMRTLLVSGHRVSRAWKSAVTSSPRLQKLLYFKVDDFRGDDHVKGKPNPLLEEAFPAWFPKQRHWNQQYEEEETRETEVTSEEENIVDDHDEDEEEEEEEEEEEAAVHFPHRAQYPKQPFSRDRKAFEFADASWRKMLTHNSPPIRSIAIWSRTKVWNGSSDETTCTFYSVRCFGDVDGAEDKVSEDETRLVRADLDEEGKGHGVTVTREDHSDDGKVGLRMDQYFTFLLQQEVTDANSFTRLHFTWCGASSPYLAVGRRPWGPRKLPGLPDDNEVVDKWEEVASATDLVVSHEHSKGWCGTRFGPRHWEITMRQLGESLVGHEVNRNTVVGGLEPAWRWKLDVAKRN